MHTLHVVSLPHTQLTKDYSMCAYTEKVRKFAKMMAAKGHKVVTYASEDNASEVCITKGEQANFGFNGPQDYLKIDFNDPKLWPLFNERVIEKLKQNIQPRDLICVITGTPAQPIKNAFPDNLIVEFGIGYSGIMNPSFRVFESYAWRNFVYGKYDMDGQFYDEVIPNYFEIEDFPEAEPEDYYLFVGRLDSRKGLNIAQEACKKLGKRLVVAGPGNFTGYGEYIGVVNPTKRGELMSKAAALFVPTMYIPPFEGVHVEAQLCGTPVITTDFGVFSETVDNGVNGYRCKTFADFLEATEKIWSLDRSTIRQTAQDRYSLETVGTQYEDYFNRLLTLHDKGWYTEPYVLNQP